MGARSKGSMVVPSGTISRAARSSIVLNESFRRLPEIPNIFIVVARISFQTMKLLKRILKIAALVVLLFVLVAGSLFASAILGRQPLVDGQDVGGIRLLAEGFSQLAI